MIFLDYRSMLNYNKLVVNHYPKYYNIFLYYIIYIIVYFLQRFNLLDNIFLR